MKFSSIKYERKKSGGNFFSEFSTLCRILFLVVITFNVEPFEAGAATWVGNTSSDFNTGANWSGGVVPTLAGDTFVFNAAGSSGLVLNNNLTGQVLFSGGISFNSGAGAYTLNGNAVTLGTTIGVTFTNGSSNAQIINLPLNLAQNLTIAGGASMTLGGSIGQAGTFGGRTITNNLTAGTLTISGTVNMSDGTARAWTFGGSSSGRTNVTGNLVNGGAGASQLTVAMANPLGSLVLSGSNTYTGRTTVSSGTLSLDFSSVSGPLTNIINNVANSSGLTLSGGTLDLTGGAGEANSQRFNGTTFDNRRASALRVTQNGATSINITLGGITRNIGSTVDFTLPTSGVITTTSTTASIGTNNVLASSAGNAYATVDGVTWATNTAGTIGALATGSYVSTFASSADNDVSSNLAPAAFTTNTVRFSSASRVLTLDAVGVSTITSGGILITAAGGGSSIASAGGAAALRPGSARDLVIINNSTGTEGFTINARIVDNSTSGLTVSGSGITMLTATNNSYVGPTQVVGSILDVGSLSNGSLGGGGLNLATGGVLQANGTFSRALTNGSPAAVGEVAGASGGFAARGGTLSVNFGGAGALVTLSGGNFAFGDNFIFGSPTADSGVIVLNPLATGGFSRTFTVNSGMGGDYAELRGVLSGSGTITKNGAGRLILSAVNNTYSGSTVVNGGVLEVGTISNGSLGSGGLTLNNDSVLQGNGVFTRTFSSSPGLGQLAGASGGFAAKGGTLTINFGGNVVPDTVSLSTTSLRFGTNFVFGSETSDSPVVVLNPLTTNGTFERVFTVNSGLGGDFADLQGVISDTGSIVKNGNGILIFSAANTYSGTTTLNAGTLRLNNGGTGGTSSAIGTGIFSIVGGTIDNTTGGPITLSTNNPVNIDGNFVFGGTQDLNFGNGIVSIGGFSRVVTLNGDKTLTMGQLRWSSNFDRTLTVNQGTGVGGSLSFGGFLLNTLGTATGSRTRIINGSADVEITGPVADGNAFANNLTYGGTGTLTLTATSSYTGTTSISGGGTLDVGTISTGALGSGGLLFSNGSVLQGNGTFTRTFSGTSTAAAGQISGVSGGFAARGGTLTVNFGGSGNQVSLRNDASRFGTNFVFGSSSADSPVVVVNPLSLSGGTRTFTVNPGVGGDYAELRGVISSGNPGEGIIKGGNGLLVLSAANTYNGSTTINAGTLQLGLGGTTGSINATSGITNNGTLAFNRSNALSIATNIGGTGAVRQMGTGTTTLSGLNTYGGTTTVSAGTLVIDGNQSGATGAVNVEALGTLGGSGTVGGATTILGTHNPGSSPGIQTFVSDLTYSGGASVVNWELTGNTITNAANPNAIFDQVFVGGDLDFAGATTLNLFFNGVGSGGAGTGVNWTDALWGSNRSWELYNVTGSISGFSNLSLAIANWGDESGDLFDSVLGGSSFSLSLDGQIVRLNFTAIPEPSRAALVLVGLLCLGLRRRRNLV